MENKMSIQEQMVRTLFLKSTIDKVKNQFVDERERVHVENDEIDFRLFRANPDFINLEVLMKMPIENSSQSSTDIKKANVQRTITFFKPIGFYDKNMNIYVLKQFENDIISLKDKGYNLSTFSIKFLPLVENAVIAAYSMNTILTVLHIYKELHEKGFEDDIVQGIRIPASLKFDKELLANGLKSELIMTFNGYPEFNLDDSYDLRGAICAYIEKDGNLEMYPMVDYEEITQKLLKMQLLSAYKVI